MRLTDMLALSVVPRWTIVPHALPQSVSDHSFRVVIIYLELCERLSHPVDLNTLRWAIFHDGGESRSGDISGRFKRPIADQVSQRESEMCPWLLDEAFYPETLGGKLVKLADLIETYTFIRMYGIGVYAERVANAVERDVHAQAAKVQSAYSFKVLGGVPIATEVIIEAILTEAGRFQP